MGTYTVAGHFLQLGGVPQDIHATHAARALGLRLQGGRGEGGVAKVKQAIFLLFVFIVVDPDLVKSRTFELIR
jgi:hypothetical protein